MIKWLKKIFGDFSCSKPEEIVKPKRRYTRITALIKYRIIACNKEGYSTKNIANILNISENSVRRTLKEHNAKKQA